MLRYNSQFHSLCIGHGHVATPTPCDVHVVMSRLYQGINKKQRFSLLKPILQWQYHLVSSNPPSGHRWNIMASVTSNSKVQRKTRRYQMILQFCMYHWTISLNTVLKRLRFSILIFAVFLPDFIFLYHDTRLAQVLSKLYIWGCRDRTLCSISTPHKTRMFSVRLGSSQ